MGQQGLVARFPLTNKVIKITHGDDPEAQARSAVEVQVYERFRQSSMRPTSILRYFNSSRDGIVLEYAENGSFRHFLRQQKTILQERLLIRWAVQAAEALRFCHLHDVLHGDINCSNFFLDGDLNLKLGDFAGSSIDGSPALVCYSTTHQLPDDTPSDAQTITETTEIFAFGSFLYEMLSGGCEPYSDKKDSEVENLYRRKIFPNVSDFGVLGPVVLACWNVEFDNMTQVATIIKTKDRHSRMQATVAIAFTFVLSIHVLHNLLQQR